MNIFSGETVESEEVHLIVSFASLFSGNKLTDCQDSEDPSCRAGVAAVATWTRYYASKYNATTLVAPQFDYLHPFIQQHPLGWEANRLVYQQLMGWKLFLARIWFTDASQSSGRDLKGIQTKDFPLLLSNTMIPPSDSWYNYVEGVFFDEDTSLALIHLVENIDNSDRYVEAVSTAKSLLTYINRVNELSGCLPNTSPYDLFLRNAASSNVETDMETGRCWIPVIITDFEVYRATLIDDLISHFHPPSLFVDHNDKDPSLTTDVPVKLTRGDASMWAIKLPRSSTSVSLMRLTKQKNSPILSNVTLATESLLELPMELKDSTYVSDIAQLRKWADETIENDPVVGRTEEFRVAKTLDQMNVTCEAGECEHGNLFTDALRWGSDADFAFENSGAYHGLGWPAGDVKVSNLWETIPFSNSLCVGTMSGINLFRLMNFSVSEASFSFINTVEGGNLQQVSGLRVVYNTQLDAATGKLISLEIWNKTQQAYVPVERLHYYKFATNSYNCCCNAPFNQMTSAALAIPGEIPGKILPRSVQQLVADYLLQLNETYSAELQDRLVNDTSVVTHLDLTQNENDCSDGLQYWSKDYQTCFDCPTISNVVPLISYGAADDLIGVSGQSSQVLLQAIIENKEDFGIDLSIDSISDFLACSSNTYTNSRLAGFCDRQDTFRLDAGQRLELELGVNFQALQPGMVQGVIAIDVADSGDFPGCLGQGIALDVELQVIPSAKLNQLGRIRYVGLCLAGLVLTYAFLFACWCLYFRNRRSVRLMQPMFLVTLCFGIFVIGSALIPMSIDDEIVSDEVVDRHCMASVWLLSLGFSVSFAALFAKLKRVNKIMSNAEAFRRVAVREQDMLGSICRLVVANLVVLITWTVVDPLQWERLSVDEQQSWNTYGTCKTRSVAGHVLMWILILMNLIALSMACWEAYKARYVSEELSEASRLGMALFSWAQLSFISIPVMLLLDPFDTIVNYFIRISLIFLGCMSLLLWVFVPLMKKEEDESVTDLIKASTLSRTERMDTSGTDSKQKQERSRLGLP